MKSSEKKLAYNRARYAAKKASISAKGRVYYLKNRSTIRARQKQYYERTLDARYAYNRTERVRERWRRYDVENREARRIAALERRKANPGMAYLASRRYYAKHPERKTHDDAVRRARRAGADGKHTFSQWQSRKEEFENRCGYCGEGGVRLVKDHDVPLARGGSDDIANIVPACWTCNSQKRALTGAEYRAQFHAARA